MHTFINKLHIQNALMASTTRGKPAKANHANQPNTSNRPSSLD